MTSDFSGTGKGITWCTGMGQTRITGAVGTKIGSGYTNTTRMMNVCNPSDAGEVARSYRGGGMTDWSLASDDELTALYNYGNRAAIGGFNTDFYWSSSQWDETFAIGRSMGNGTDTHTKEGKGLGVRPVRAF
jgi:hypothetical protein